VVGHRDFNFNFNCNFNVGFTHLLALDGDAGRHEHKRGGDG
jgi:hypothetical protein